MTKKVFLFIAIGVVLGALGGYLYYAEIGCVSGSCAITSKPVNSTLYGALIGGLLFNILRGHLKSSPKREASYNCGRFLLVG